ncbi:MAG: hypothetical protein GDA53_11885 [Rhodobacteraceae bacterium]|nr:hypothetical protein [Paracoccaceae bacterium]
MLRVLKISLKWVLIGLGLLTVLAIRAGPPLKDKEKAAREAGRQGRKAARIAEESEKRRRGFRCLSTWDGSHPHFKRHVRSLIRDPDSFKHMETRVSPVSKNGTHTFWMTCRARNGFGGMNVGKARGTYRNDNCQGFSLSQVE